MKLEFKEHSQFGENFIVISCGNCPQKGFGKDKIESLFDYRGKIKAEINKLEEILHLVEMEIKREKM